MCDRRGRTNFVEEEEVCAGLLQHLFVFVERRREQYTITTLLSLLTIFYEDYAFPLERNDFALITANFWVGRNLDLGWIWD